ncbi:LysE family translocator [Streptomyces sp. HNM0574]|uniref:LysE family translocator n=1 Tax=Streptomyces sp. HNM0574 TaxID=2714954 RepID=UPI00146D994D|nr:LysE family translocator [Streptomyces sp. HNM0574]NLU66049.1 LysE family translocator [Streptomyces sp. HNM0574]
MDVSSALTSFALVAAVLTITPGLDTALVLRSAVTRGRRHAMVTSLGIISGAFVWGVAASVGISALLTASHLAYTVLKVVGAAYMLWLGFSMIRKTLRRRGRPEEAVVMAEAAPAGGEERALRVWSRGMLTNLLNPKVGVFYVAMLPQFIPVGAPHLPMGLGLALIHALEAMLWFTLLTFGTGLAKGWFQRGAVRRGMDRVTGVVLVGFGLNLVLGGK